MDYRSKLMAGRIATELAMALRYCLRMMGVPIDGPTDVYCDNKGLVITAQRPESTLKKKHNAVNWHRIREAIAMKMARVAKESSETNLADGLTKLLSTLKRRNIFSSILF